MRLRLHWYLPTSGDGRAISDHDQVAGLIEEYAAAGIEEFILSGSPQPGTTTPHTTSQPGHTTPDGAAPPGHSATGQRKLAGSR